MLNETATIGKNGITWKVFISIVLLVYIQYALFTLIAEAVIAKSFILVIYTILIIVCAYYSIHKCYYIQKSINELQKSNISKMKIFILIIAFLFLLLIKYYAAKYGPSNEHKITFLDILNDTYFPVLEEYAYRGCLILLLCKKLKKAWMVAVVSSIIFTFAHLDYNYNHIINYFMWGYLLAYSFLCTKTLVPGVVMHMVGNASIDIFPMIKL
jgi:membrane protease YdiL (CAAX protease family)